MMTSLQPPDAFHLQAAQGWLELGDYIEANEELEEITPELRAHPAVLNVRWGVCAAEKKWDAALDIATTIIQLNPEDPLGWVHRSYALHQLKRTAEARDNLLCVVNKFRRDEVIHYNLACYECRLSRLEQAMQWLKLAFLLGGKRRMKRAALDDPDLEPLWADICRT
jgi:tetratricopeptide (TPR) repeat protein